MGARDLSDDLVGRVLGHPKLGEVTLQFDPRHGWHPFSIEDTEMTDAGLAIVGEGRRGEGPLVATPMSLIHAEDLTALRFQDPWTGLDITLTRVDAAWRSSRDISAELLAHVPTSYDGEDEEVDKEVDKDRDQSSTRLRTPPVRWFLLGLLGWILAAAWLLGVGALVAVRLHAPHADRTGQTPMPADLEQLGLLALVVLPALAFYVFGELAMRRDLEASLLAPSL